MTDHISRRELLLHLDGELSRRRSRQVQAHLLSCWHCRRELESLERDIHAIVDAQNRSFLPSAPRPVRSWDNFEELARALPAPRFQLGAWFRRAAGFLAAESFSSVRWATAVVTLVCFVATALWLTPERLSAETVLRRMEQAESVRRTVGGSQVIRQRILVERTDRRNLTRHSTEVESWKAGSRGVWRGDNAGLRQRYRDRGLESSLPLSPISTERWLGETQAETKLSRAGDTVDLQAHSTRVGGDLESVSVRVRKGTWHLEAIRLTFSDSIFDVAELDLTVLRKDELSPDLLAELEPAPVIEARSRSSVARSILRTLPSTAPAINPLEEELAVQYRLHEIGADLTDPIELKQEQGKIVIMARGASADRKQQLAELFGTDPHVRLETDVNGSEFDASAPLSLPITAASPHKPDQQLVEFLGSPEAQENFTRSVLDTDASILARLYALRKLAQHWPSDVEPSLSPERREQLRTIVQDHLRALDAGVPELQRLLAPLVDRLCGPTQTAPTTLSAHSDWRESAASGLASARALDRELRALLTTSNAQTTLSAACPGMKSNLTVLSDSLPGQPKP